MFMSTMTQSPLVGPAANEIFKNISGVSYREDVMFLSVMRMLLYHRLPDDQKASLRFMTAASPWATVASVISNPDPDQLHVALAGDHISDVSENTVYVIEVPLGEKEDEQRHFDAFASVEKFGAAPTDAMLDAIMAKSSLKVRCFVDPERSITYLVVFSRMLTIHWHIFSIFTSRYFMRYFKEKPLTDAELAAVRSIEKEKDGATLKRAFKDFASQFDFRSPAIRAMLDGFENRTRKKQVDMLKREVDRNMEQITNNLRTYRDLLRQRRTLEEKQAVFNLNPEKSDHALMDYFLSNQNLYLSEVRDDNVTFYVKTPYANYPQEFIEKILENPQRAERADLYTAEPTRVSAEKRDKLFRAMFIDRSVRVWLFGQFTLSLSGDLIRAYSGFDVPDEMVDTCPNPHLFLHACMGDNERFAIENVMSGDFVTAIEQCIGAVASVNLMEGVTANPWMKMLLSDKYGKIFETQDGQRMTFTEVMEWLEG